MAISSRQAFAERRFGHAWVPSRFDSTRAERMRSLLVNRPAGWLLDVGCYDGQLVSNVAVPRAAERIVGVDVAPAPLLAARERGVLGVRAQVEARLPFRDGAFGTVVAAEVIEHVFDTRALLAELKRVLAADGWLLITTPNLVALSGRAKMLLGKSPANVEVDAGPETSGHIRYFTFDTLERLLREIGMRPLGRWTNVAHFSVLGSSVLVGRLAPGLGHTLVSVSAHADRPGA